MIMDCFFFEFFKRASQDFCKRKLLLFSGKSVNKSVGKSRLPLFSGKFG